MDMAYPIYWTSEKIEKLKDLYKSGLSMREVGIYFGKTVWAINNIMQRHRISRRPASITNTFRYYRSPLSFSPNRDLSAQEELLKTAGLMLYWAEGGKRNSGGIDFANSDPKMIKIFLQFLRKIYKVSESRLRVYLYSYHSLPTNQLVEYWSQITNIPSEQFSKPYIRIKSAQKHDKMQHGLIHIRYSDKRLLELVMSEIKQFIASWDGGAVKHTTL